MHDPNNLASNFGKQYYATQLGIYDEMYATTNKALPYWERFMGALAEMGTEKLELRRYEAQRLLRENGVTYNVYGDSQRLTRPWQLDPVPLLISHEEWQVIEAGLKQRAELLNLILKDIYANQLLLKNGLLPVELIFGHDGFLHPCIGALKNQPQALTFYAANLARGPNGRMWVLDDRAQAPSGAGYALENRTVMTRVLPEIFRETNVQRLSGFFKTMYKGLADSATHNKDDPRIVILTPGPLNETYFEHAYLAAYLGFTLVQGGDLTVRDGRVWLKSLTGLQAVDVILRRVDDSFCDPLELRSDSQLGVAGLLQVVRQGNVAIANPLGSSILENPGLLAFLPGLCRYFFNEELKLPSIATWWCGQRREREFVLANFDHLVIKPINRSLGSHAVFTGLLSAQEKDDLRNLILAKPHLFIGQEQVSFSTLPAFIDQHIEPRNAVIRNFAVANGDGYSVMPGGLTRVSRQKDGIIVSNQSGGISKDTWVLATENDRPISVWNQPNPKQWVDAIAEPLTSRSADNLFWVGRYLERIESTARLLRTVLMKLRQTLEFKDAFDKECLKLLLPALTYVSGTFPGFTKERDQLSMPYAELLALAKDSQRKGALAANIQAFAQSAFSIRDLWSQDTWRSIDNIQDLWLQRVVNQDINAEQLQVHLDDLMDGIVAFTGLTSESMTRESAWLMLDSGRRLERAIALMTLLRTTLALRCEDSLQNALLEAVLVTTDSLTIYQRRYRSFIQLPMVLELLLLDGSHPRSVAYQLHQLSIHLGALPRIKTNQLSQEERLILKAYTDLRLCNVFELTKIDNNADFYPGLDQILANTVQLLQSIADVIAEAFFSHSQASQLMLQNAVEDDV